MRLIQNDQALVVDGLFELVGNLNPFLHLFAHAGCEEGHRMLAAFLLGIANREVGAAEEGIGLHAIGLVGNADARTQGDLVIVDYHRTVDFFPKGVYLRALALDRMVEAHEELVGTRVHDNERIELLEPFRELLDNLVTYRMPVRVVDIAELVDIELDHALHLVRLVFLQEYLVEPLQVRQVRQAIEVQTMLQVVARLDDFLGIVDRTPVPHQGKGEDAY